MVSFFLPGTSREWVQYAPPNESYIAPLPKVLPGKALTSEEIRQAETFLRRAVEYMGLDEETYDVLRTPERVIQVKVPVRCKDGRVRVFVGWRSQHNSALGPYKGGVRYHPDVTMEEVIALSMLMTWKNALAGLPYGGGKGGVRVDPKRLTKEELQSLSRAYIRALARYIGPDIDVPGPDIYTDQETMAWYFDEFSTLSRGDQLWGVVTSKPVLLGGMQLRVKATGLGVALVTKLAAERLWGSLEGVRVAFHGFGNVGQHAALYLRAWGANVVAAADSKSAIYLKEGLDVQKLVQVKRETDSLELYPGASRLSSPNEVIAAEADVLIPASISGVIDKGNAKSVRARLVVEGANAPVTVEAEDELVSRGIIVVPDILANSGGVIASHIEWVNNRMGGWIKEKEAEERLLERMSESFESVWSFWNKNLGGTRAMRLAAYVIAVDRVVRAMKLRGML